MAHPDTFRIEKVNLLTFRDAIEDVFAVRAGRIQGGQIIRQFNADNSKALAPVTEEEE